MKKDTPLFPPCYMCNKPFNWFSAVVDVLIHHTINIKLIVIGL